MTDQEAEAFEAIEAIWDEVHKPKSERFVPSDKLVEMFADLDTRLRNVERKLYLLETNGK